MTIWLLPETVKAKDWWFVPALGPIGLPAYIGIWIIAAIAFTLGAWIRGSGIILTATIGYKLLLDQNLFSNHEYLLALLTALLTVSDSGAWGSIDAWRSRGRDAISYWPVWLVKVQLSLMYAFTALAKFLSRGFMSGKVLSNELALPALLNVEVVVVSAPWVVVAVEVGMAIGLWIPRLQGYCVLFGAVFHLLIVLLVWRYTIELSVFCIIAVVPYILFLNLEPSSRVVLWDDACSLCGRWVRLFRALDWFGVYRFVGSSDAQTVKDHGISPREAHQAIQLLGPSGRASGVDAIGGIMSRLPATFVLGPVFSLPGIRQIADRAYRHVARRRNCNLSDTGRGSRLT